MPRPSDDHLAPIDTVDIAPVLHARPDDVPWVLAELFRLGDSELFRRHFMRSVQFPSDDITLFLTVNQLAMHGALRPTELASTLQTSRSNVSKIARKLGALGLVALTPDPADDRGVLLALTHQGRELGQRIIESGRALLDTMLTNWSAEEVAMFGQLAGKLVQSMRAMLEPLSAPTESAAPQTPPARST